MGGDRAERSVGPASKGPEGALLGPQGLPGVRK